MTLAVAIGNTNLRFLLDGAAAVAASRRGVERIVDDLAFDFLDGLGPATEVAVASVNDACLRAFEVALERRGLSATVLGRDLPVPIENRYDDPRQVGIDRLLVVLAATVLHPGEGVLVVDFGTALTVNVGSPDGAFLGGFIGIGASTAARALREHAPRLPRVDPEPPSELPRDTESAIRGGLYLEITGGVERMLGAIREGLPWPTRVLATGGDARGLAPGVPSIERVDDDLVLRGVLAAIERARGEA